jgi:type IV secretion system protein VirD4
MSRLQSVLMAVFVSVCGFLAWSLFYALAYDVRSYLMTRQYDFDKSFFALFSDNLLTPARHAIKNWPPAPSLSHWQSDFTVQNSLAAILPVALLAVVAAIVKRQMRPPVHHGDAQLLRPSELTRAGLARKNGLQFGKVNRITVRDDEQSHLLVIGPPASGKTECFVIPNLIEWDGTFIALDFKGTLYERTAKIRRKRGDAVFLLAPGLAESHTYNPLDLLRPGAGLITDIQALASLIVPVLDAREAHWNQSAQMLLCGMIGYVQESHACEGARHLAGVVDLFSATKSFKKTCEIMTQDPSISEWTRARIIEYMAVPDEEAGSIASTLNRHLMPWQNPNVAALTMSTKNAIPLELIRKKRMAVYLIIDTGQIDIFAPVLKLFLEQLNSIVNRDYRKPDENKILFMIDEFYQLGRIKSIVNQLPFARDRDIRICLVSQGVAQIDEKFGRDGRDAIMASCAVKIFCAFNDKPTVDLVTHMAGGFTHRVDTVSRQMNNGLARKTRNEQFIARPLFRPDELYTWPRDDLLIMRVNTNPLIVKKILADKTGKYRRLYSRASKLKIPVPQLTNAAKFIPNWGDTRRGDTSAVTGPTGAGVELSENNSVQTITTKEPATARPEQSFDRLVELAAEAQSANSFAGLADVMGTDSFDDFLNECAAAAEILTDTEAELAASAVEDKSYTRELIDDTRTKLTSMMVNPTSKGLAAI